MIYIMTENKSFYRNDESFQICPSQYFLELEGPCWTISIFSPPSVVPTRYKTETLESIAYRCRLAKLNFFLLITWQSFHSGLTLLFACFNCTCIALYNCSLLALLGHTSPFKISKKKKKIFLLLLSLNWSLQY